jgi:2-polyprenyl-3-methyl-5-hydroxy-6-metoxy-1,4-benzoquinol methylase
MNSREFGAYKARYRAAIQQVLSEAEPGRLDEIGFPAYSHANPLISWLFWKRLHTVMDYIERAGPFKSALDFGCGSGVMLPFLASMSREVVATVIDLLALETMKTRIPLAANVQVRDASPRAMSQLAAACFDLILALDVLEHVKDLAGTLEQLMRLLRPGGQLVISGPTESVLYRFGRKLAGPEYSGDYHERGVAEIRQVLARRANLKQIATLYWPVPLFEIFTATA